VPSEKGALVKISSPGSIRGDGQRVLLAAKLLKEDPMLIRDSLTNVVVSREVCRHKAHPLDHVPAVLAQDRVCLFQGLC